MKPYQTKLSVFVVLLIVVLLGVDFASAQARFPRESQRAMVSQTIGVTDVTVVYHRPAVKGRAILGCTAPPEDFLPTGKTYPCLVPYNQVWRMGANDSTTFEITDDVMINGQKLTKGKYSIHAIPNATEWIIAFNKDAAQWGSFNYKDKEDALRITVKPETSAMQERLIYEFADISENKTMLSLRWEHFKVSFSIEVPDQNTVAIKKAQSDIADLSRQTANYILQNKLKDRYAEALSLINNAISIRENFAHLNLKARLLAEMGNFKEAVMIGEKAVQVGKAANANTAAFEKTVSEWKQKTQ